MAIKQLSQDRCLLNEVVHILNKMDHKGLSKALVLLPTGRLGTLLVSMLCKLKPSTLIPQIQTLENFCASGSLIPDLNSTNREVADQLYCELLIGSLIRQSNFKQIKIGHIHEITQLFKDIEDEQDSEIWDKFYQYVDDSTVGKIEYQEMLKVRVDELKTLYETFHKKLSEKNLATASGSQLILSKRMILKLKEENRFETIVIAGFSTVKPFYIPLLRYMGALNSTRLVLSKPLKLFAKVNPLEELIHSITNIKPGDEAADEHVTIKHNSASIYEATNPVEECLMALELVKESLESGIAPNHIGLLVADESTYGPILKTFCQELKIEANIALSEPLSKSPLGTWLTSMQEYCKPNATLESVLEFIGHELTKRFLIKHLEKHELDFQSINSSAMDHYFDFIGKEDFTSKFPESPLSKTLAILNEPLSLFLKAFDETSQKSKDLSIERWLEMLQEIVHIFEVENFEAKTRFVRAGEEASQKESLTTMFNALGSLAKAEFATFNSGDFWKFFNDRILTLETRAIGYPLKGVQILSFVEARFVPFKKTILLGCLEGYLPRALPDDILIHDSMKKRVGLKSWEYIEALEDTTFHLLLSRAKDLHLFYSESIGGSPQVRSRFIEQLLATGKGNLVGQKTLPTQFISGIDASPIKEEERSNLPMKFLEKENTPFIEGMSLLTQSLSATSIQSLLRCPYQFALKRLGVKANFPVETKALMMEGNTLHQIIEDFFQNKIETGKFKDTDPNKELDKIVDELIQITKRRLPDHPNFNVLRHHLNHFSWPRFAEFVLGKLGPLNKKTKILNEEFFSLESEINSKEPLKVGIIGRIDQILSTGNSSTIIDFKRKRVPTKIQVTELESPQLPLYALAHSHDSKGTELDNLLLGYYSILEGKWYPIESGEGIDEEMRFSLHPNRSKKSLGPKKLVEDLREKLQDTVSQIQEQKDFFTVVKDDCKMCDYRGICRASS